MDCIYLLSLLIMRGIPAGPQRSASQQADGSHEDQEGEGGRPAGGVGAEVQGAGPRRQEEEARGLAKILPEDGAQGGGA